jgi:hypothetical protein
MLAAIALTPPATRRRGDRDGHGQTRRHRRRPTPRRRPSRYRAARNATVVGTITVSANAPTTSRRRRPIHLDGTHSAQRIGIPFSIGWDTTARRRNTHLAAIAHDAPATRRPRRP